MFMILGQEECEEEWVDDDDDDDDEDDEENDGDGLQDMDECEESACGNSHDHGHGHGHYHNNNGMDDAETGDSSLDKLNTILREYGVDSIFPPLDGTALYSMMCKINHSCSPNVRVKYFFTKEHGLVASLVATREIQPDEELLQSYIDQTMGMCSLFPLACLCLPTRLFPNSLLFSLVPQTLRHVKLPLLIMDLDVHVINVPFDHLTLITKKIRWGSKKKCILNFTVLWCFLKVYSMRVFGQKRAMFLLQKN